MATIEDVELILTIEDYVRINRMDTSAGNVHNLYTTFLNSPYNEPQFPLYLCVYNFFKNFGLDSDSKNL